MPADHAVASKLNVFPASAKTTKADRRAQQERERADKQLRKASPLATTFLLVRHGETSWNVEHRLQGQKDPPLNTLGQRQAAALAQRLAEEHFSGLVYSSDLQRAVQTANAIVNLLPSENCVHTTIDFRERSLGVLEGLTAAEAASQKPEAYALLCSKDPCTAIPGGESLQEVTDRALRGLQDISRRHPGQQVIVVLHGGVLQAIYRHAAKREFKGLMKNCAINTLAVDGEKWFLGCWGDVAHLAAIGAQEEAFGGSGG